MITQTLSSPSRTGRQEAVYKRANSVCASWREPPTDAACAPRVTDTRAALQETRSTRGNGIHIKSHTVPMGEMRGSRVGVFYRHSIVLPGHRHVGNNIYGYACLRSIDRRARRCSKGEVARR